MCRAFFNRSACLSLLVSILALAACGGSGDGGASGGMGADARSKLFVADSGRPAIVSLKNANPSSGILTADRTIVGANTAIWIPRGFVLDKANDRLYVANGNSILVFHNASRADGDISPTRTITSTQFGSISTLYLDTANDVLYVGDDLKGVWVFNNASTVNGGLLPNRSITGSSIIAMPGVSTTFLIGGLAVDTARNLLYVSRLTVSPSTNQIIAFNNASTIDGNGLTADRVIAPNPTASAGRIFIDSSADRIYLADTSSMAVRVFDHASTADGSVAPDRTINLNVALTDLTVDTANNRLYALNTGMLYIVGNASTADGTVAATAMFAPSGVLAAVAVKP